MIAITKRVWEKIEKEILPQERVFIDEVDNTFSDIVYMDKLISLDIPKEAPFLITPIEVRNGNTTMKVFAVWDTGATTTGIAMRVARRLDLKPTGEKEEIITANGTIFTDTTFIEIKMPDNIYKKFKVNIVPEQDNSISIGLDIIMSGRFLIEPTETGARMTFNYNPKQ